MRNPWLEIRLDDYEAHMSLPSIGQAQMLESNRILGVCDAAKNGWSTPKQQPRAHSAADLVVCNYT
jgi:hypothetical protein